MKWGWIGVLLAAATLSTEAADSFTLLKQAPTHKIEIDMSTFKEQLDSKDEPLVSAVFRTTYNTPIMLSGVPASVFIDAVIGICGYDGLVIVKSTAIGTNGKTIGTNEEPRSRSIDKIPGTFTYEAYRRLCNGRGKANEFT